MSGRDIAAKLKSAVLMLSSPYEGEIVAAARAIDRLLRAMGLDWHALANKVDNDKAPTPQQLEQLQQLCTDQYRTIERQRREIQELRRERDQAAAQAAFMSVDEQNWRMMRDTCLKQMLYLHGRERTFVESLQHWHGDLSEKQRDWLTAIYQRVKDKPA
jgi:hypothetical protein